MIHTAATVNDGQVRTFAAPQQPAADDVLQAVVIPASEWERIKDSLDRRQREREEQGRARQCREDRRLESQKIVKNWENTIEVRITLLLASIL